MVGTIVDPGYEGMSVTSSLNFRQQSSKMALL